MGIFGVICSLLLLRIAICELEDQNQESTSSVPISTISIPLVLHNADQSVTHSTFSFDFLAPHNRLEFCIGAFCEAHNIRHSFCKKLYETADQRVKAAKEEYYRTVSVQHESQSSQASKPVNSSYILRQDQSGQVSLLRHFASHRSLIQFQQLYLRQSAANEISFQEARAVSELAQHLVHLRRHAFIKRMVFIHSSLFIYQNSGILESMLKKLQSSGVYWESDLICVLHYGQPLQPIMLAHFPEVKFLHMSKQTSLFEIPTLRVMQQIAMHLSPVEKEHTHMLYLHTLGQSYFLRYDNLDDWRNMMLYFLVDRYFDQNYHLLASGVYDVLGLNYERQPRRFHGNFWWTTAKYLASISPFALDMLNSNFMEIDHFIFQSPHVRIYILHNADIDHHHNRYPPYCYRTLTMEELLVLPDSSPPVVNEDGATVLRPPSYTIWSETCKSQDKFDYLRLHHPELIPDAMFATDNKLGVDIARCQSLDLSSS